MSFTFTNNWKIRRVIEEIGYYDKALPLKIDDDELVFYIVFLVFKSIK